MCNTSMMKERLLTQYYYLLIRFIPVQFIAGTPSPTRILLKDAEPH